MKKILGFLCFTAVICCFPSCQDMLTVDSDRYLTVDKNGLTSGNDSISSILGLLTGMQKIGERYFLFGEMRGDLLNTTDYTPADIRSLSDFTVSDTSAYANPRDYYAIINNCNYFISRTSDSISPLATENAVAHAIRAWTYMQIVFNWGKASYFTEPLLSVEDTEKDFPVYTIPQMIDALIADLQPFVGAKYPDYGDIYGLQSSQIFIPVEVLLGDLYLWRGNSTDDYEQAATYYANYIDKNNISYALVDMRSVYWSYDNFLLQNFDKVNPSDAGWTTITYANSSNTELISAIEMATTPSQGITNKVIGQNASFNNNNNTYTCTYFEPSGVINNLWDDQVYVLHYVSGAMATDYVTMGDLRKWGNCKRVTNGGSYRISNGTGYITGDILTKLYMANNIMLYRLGLVMLRYAEAVNRAGKPNTAFAVLKYGLDPVTLRDTTRIPRSELADAKPYITIFNNQKYTNTNSSNSFQGTGIHSRGCGSGTSFNQYYTIGGTTGAPLTSLSDSIQRVENMICDELALETSFEGNRFQDLMRIALRRNDPSFLAARVAAKHVNDYNRVYGLLMDKNNWFLPEKK